MLPPGPRLPSTAGSKASCWMSKVGASDGWAYWAIAWLKLNWIRNILGSCLGNIGGSVLEMIEIPLANKKQHQHKVTQAQASPKFIKGNICKGFQIQMYCDWIPMSSFHASTWQGDDSHVAGRTWPSNVSPTDSYHREVVSCMCRMVSDRFW